MADDNHLDAEILSAKQVVMTPFTPVLVTVRDASSSGKSSLAGHPGNQDENTDSLPSRVGPFVLKAFSGKTPPVKNGKNTMLDQKDALRPLSEGGGSASSPRKASRTQNFLYLYQAPILTHGKTPQNTSTELCKQTPTPTQIASPDNPMAQPKIARKQDSGYGHSHGHRDYFGSTDEPRAIRGDFIPVSTSLRSRSPPPSNDQSSQHVLQLSLTDSQMEKITAALSSDDSAEWPSRGRRNVQSPESVRQANKENMPPRASTRSRSPEKLSQDVYTPSRDRSRSPTKFSSMGRRVAYDFGTKTTPQSPSKKKERRNGNDGMAPVAYPPSPVRHGGRKAPDPIDTKLAQEYAENAELARQYSKMMAERGYGQIPIAMQRQPEVASSSAPRQSQFVPSDESSSVYSQERKSVMPISPLRIRKEEEPRHLSILQEYTDWKNSPCVPEPDVGNLRPSPADGELDDELAYERLGAHIGWASGPEPMYSPLPPLSGPRNTNRKTSKTLIGENGWLESTSKPPVRKSSPTRKPGFIDNLFKKAKEMVEGSDTKTQRKSRDSDKSQKGQPVPRSLAISLDPRDQGLLYCELEFILVMALNDYILAQFNAGRLETDKLRKVSESWQRKGRPKVVGFRYDLETQLELIGLHVNDFKFYGQVASPVAISGIIEMMKVDARALRIRTFCHPDTVIAKQLGDAQILFNLLGCPDNQQVKLAEIIGFYKAAIYKAAMEREKLGASRDAGANATGTELHRTKSLSGEKWRAANDDQIRRTNSHVGVKLDPGDYESDRE
ncbi:hypothetical protein B0T22DRAFT_444158 [Podospora appendiculata]|uniref:Uncharacterized protein n=1 Tax=Podospora appendiculata TaxID=314037 RepID=A0AAE1C9L7_9PEZI|nr:hypothetical protein B0T22DRAFT_444158 [Podospora appendiculata]